MGTEAVEIVETCTPPPVEDPQDLNVMTGVPYREVQGDVLALDLAWPTTPGPHPLVVLVHGGGWREGGRDDLAPQVLQLAGAGYAAAAVDYRLAPEHTFPAAVSDVQCAIEWLAETAPPGEIDVGRLVLLGPSAGGHLASLLGTAPSTDFGGGCPLPPSLAPDGVVAISSPQDLGADDFPLLTRAIIEDFLGAHPDEDPSLTRVASPVTHVDGEDVPFLLVHGVEDEVIPVSQARRMFEVIRESGGAATLVRLEGVTHATSLFQGAPDEAAGDCTALRFLDETLAP